MIKSRLLQKLRSGDFVRVPVIGRVTDPWLAELLGRLGFDVIWLDMEHRPLSYDVIDPISLACRSTGIDLMVRILKTGYSSPMRVLEFGANGIMVPHCRSVEEARQWVEWTRFPPLGKRGFDGAGADADYMLVNPLDYMKHANHETFLALQIEDREAVDSVEEIAAVEGVDLLFVGPADLTISYGVAMQFDHPIVQQAIDRIASSVAKTGKWWGIPTGTPEDAQMALNKGARMVTCAVDHVLLVHGFQNAQREFSQVKIEENSQIRRSKE
ncbi:MAG: aldolase/citrate lyase family protein [Acidobacteria bacterium]|nr:aldolase/citrate lyase family protein [Acidobacteriota bacterium]MCI0719656.1 aldolase/citrate lyase family protein [Acidobacteriota bacterium]